MIIINILWFSKGFRQTWFCLGLHPQPPSVPTTICPSRTEVRRWSILRNLQLHNRHPSGSAGSFLHPSFTVGGFCRPSRPTSLQTFLSIGIQGGRIANREGNLDPNIGILQQFESTGTIANIFGNGEADDPLLCRWIVIHFLVFNIILISA